MNEAYYSHVFSKFQGMRPYGVGAWKCICPCHEDRKPSLGLKIGDTGKLLVRCYAGCDTSRILEVVGLTMEDTFPDAYEKRPKQPPKISRVYPYADENGVLLYEKVRYEPKDFRVRRPNPEAGGDPWIWNLKDTRLVVYKLPEILFETRQNPERRVFLLDGEKDVETVWGLGCLATCPPQGGESWIDEMADQLAGMHVVIVPDEDLRNKKSGLIVGHKHARRIRTSLLPKASSVTIARLPGVVGAKTDVTDLVETWPAAERQATFMKWAREAVRKKTAVEEVAFRLQDWMRIEECWFFLSRSFAKLATVDPDEMDREDVLDMAAAVLQLADAL